MEFSAEMNSSVTNTTADPISATFNPCPKSTPGLQMFFAMEGINLLVGLPVNAWTVWLITRGTSSLPAPEVFTLNLAALECVYCLLTFLRPLNFYVVRSRFLYLFNLFFYGLLTAGRPLFQCCVCLERYVAVVHPVAFIHYRPLRYRLMCLPIVWALTGLFCVANLFPLKIHVFPCVFASTLAVEAFCCVSILRALRLPSPGDREKKEGMDLMKRRACVTVAVILVMMVLNYLPAILVAPLVAPKMY